MLTPKSFRQFNQADSKALWIQAVLIYLTVFLLGLILLKPVADQEISEVAKLELKAIEQTLDGLKKDLMYLTSDDITALSCEESTNVLRTEVFNSDVAKEIGLFRPNGEIYCTSSDRGNSFYLYNSIMARLHDNGTTLSYTKSKMNDKRSVFLMFLGDSGHGVSVAIPPRYITRLLSSKEEGIQFGVEVISREIVNSESFNDAITTFSERSNRYPLSIKLHTNIDYYLQFFFSNIWVGLLLASITTIFCLRVRQRKFTDATLESALRSAIKAGEIEAYYQPIVDSRTDQIVGCESLVRWNSPVQGMISPAIFIPLADKLGLIDDITEVVLESAIELVSSHPELFENRYISINISRSQILDEAFIEQILSDLACYHQVAQKLVFEITEEYNFVPEELTALKLHLEKITSVGIHIAVDDFGTGYSGLDFIRQYSFDFIKIDRVFVTSLGRDSTTVPVLKSIGLIAQTFDMKVIVEGVEEVKQLEILTDLGFCHIQGFYYFKPMPKRELLKVLT